MSRSNRGPQHRGKEILLIEGQEFPVKFSWEEWLSGSYVGSGNLEAEDAESLKERGAPGRTSL